MLVCSNARIAEVCCMNKRKREAWRKHRIKRKKLEERRRLMPTTARKR